MSEADLVIRGDVVTPDRVMPTAMSRSAARPSRVLAKAPRPPRRSTRLPRQLDYSRRRRWDCTASQLNQEGLAERPARRRRGRFGLVDMPYDDPKAIATREEFRRKADEVKRDCHVDVALHATSAKDGIAEISGMIEAGAAAFKFSTFQATPGRFPGSWKTVGNRVHRNCKSRPHMAFTIRCRK